MKKIFPFLFIMLTACGMYQIKTDVTTNEFTGQKSTTLQLPFVIDGGMGTIWLYLDKTGENYSLIVTNSTLEWRLYRKVYLVIDKEKRYVLYAVRLTRRIRSGGPIREAVSFKLSRKVVKDLAGAGESIRVKLVGTGGDDVLVFKQKHVDAVKGWCEQVDGNR